jgi:hypothetical protein
MVGIYPASEFPLHRHGTPRTSLHTDL